MFWKGRFGLILEGLGWMPHQLHIACNGRWIPTLALHCANQLFWGGIRGMKKVIPSAVRVILARSKTVVCPQSDNSSEMYNRYI